MNTNKILKTDVIDLNDVLLTEELEPQQGEGENVISTDSIETYKILKLDVIDLNDVPLTEEPQPQQGEEEEEEKQKEILLTGEAYAAILNNPIFMGWISSIDFSDYFYSVGLLKGRQNDIVIVSYVISKVLEVSQNSQFGLGLYKETTYYFNGKYWEVLPDYILTHLLSVAAMMCGMDQYIAGANLNSFKRQFYLAGNVNLDDSQIEQIRINTQNGTVILNEVQGINPEDSMPHTVDVNVDFRPHEKNDQFKYVLDYEYDPEADCPMFKKYLDRVLPDKTLQSIILEFMGYCLTSNIKLEKMLLCYGPSGSNGKSVLYQIIKRLFGEANVSNFGTESLCHSNGYALMEVQNKLVNFCSESGQGLGENKGKLKQLISGEEVEARRIYCSPVILKLNCKLIENCNTLPKDNEITGGYFRRLLIVPFLETISAEERDIHLHTKIINSELPGILNLVIKAAKRLIKQGDFTKSETVEKLIETLREESDSVHQFFTDEGYVPSGSIKVKRSELHKKYVQYCREHGQRSVNPRTFAERLTGMQYKIDLRGTNGYAWVYCEKSITPEEIRVAKEVKQVGTVFGLINNNLKK